MSKKAMGTAAGAGVLAAVGGYYQARAAHEQRKAAFAIQKAQANINKMFAEENFKVQMEQLSVQAAQQREQMSEAARDVAKKRAADQAAARVAGAEKGGTGMTSDIILDQEAAYSAYYQKINNAMDDLNFNIALQKKGIYSEKARIDMESDLAIWAADPGDGKLAAFSSALNTGLDTFLSFLPSDFFDGASEPEDVTLGVTQEDVK